MHINHVKFWKTALLILFLFNFLTKIHGNVHCPVVTNPVFSFIFPLFAHFCDHVKVVSLREAERRLRLRCEELELHAGEQEVALRQKEAGIQRLVLDAERRLTEQQKEHQSNLQELLQKLNGEKRRHDELSRSKVLDKLHFSFPFFFCGVAQNVLVEKRHRQHKTDCSSWRKSCFSTKAPAGS